MVDRMFYFLSNRNFVFSSRSRNTGQIQVPKLICALHGISGQWGVKIELLFLWRGKYNSSISR